MYKSNPSRNKLIEIYKETSASFPNRSLWIKAKKYIPTDFKMYTFTPQQNNIQISVIDNDCIDESYKLINKNLNPVILNLASEYKPGGGWKNGSLAQEESICFRTTLYTTLDHNGLYPIPDSSLLYSPKVSVIRDSSYNIIENAYNISIISCAGLRKPIIDHNGNISNIDMNRLRVKIHLICATAIINNHKSIVLGAIGCGVFKTPVKNVVAIFKEIIPLFNFTEVVFAVKGTTFNEFYQEWKK